MRTTASRCVIAVVVLGAGIGTARMSGLAADSTSPGAVRLRCEYLVDPAGIDVARPRLTWMLDPAGPVRSQTAYRVLVSANRAALDKDRGDLWDSGRIASDESAWITYAGKPLTSGQRVYWKVRVWSDAGAASPWSAPATWSMGLLRQEDWHAKWIGQAPPETHPEGTPLPFPWLRKTLTLTQKPARAVAYVNALGYYELYINGRNVDDHVLSPAVSDYSRRNLYVAHEVADYLVPGKNVIALWLGRGWYVKGHPGVIHDGPLVRAQVAISMPDGAVTEVVTDETWRVHESPLSPLGRGTAFGDYGGERYDAAKDVPDWSGPAFDDSAWPTAAVFTPPPVPTAAQMVEPNRAVETIRAQRVEPYPEGGWVIDMGKAFTGWLEIALPEIPKGATVKLEYSDQMTPDKPAPPSPFSPAGGKPSGADAGQRGAAAGRAAATGAPAPPGATAPAGARAAGSGPGAQAGASARAGRGGNPTVFPYTFNQRDEIVGNGSPVNFRSRFNYHGFRYVRVIGLDTAPKVSEATGYLIRTAYERAGEFTSSNALLNQIYDMVTWTYESLTLGGYVVDCPTRERLGYGGDAGTSLETGMYNFSTGGLYSRWLANWRDSQELATGSLPHTAPNYPNQGGGGPMWGGFVVTLPWQMYVQYGDRVVLETNYPMIQKWLGYLESESPEYLLLDHKSHAMGMQAWNFLGDWLTPKGSLRGTVPPVQAINSTHYLYQLQLASKIAAVLGRKADAAAYDARAARVSNAIHDRFYNAADRSYTNGDSVQLAFPLLTGVVPPDLRAGVMQTLEHTIVTRNAGRLDTGMHGTYFVTKHLMDTDRNDLIHGMTNTTEYPGWGYMLANGATTAWEGWTGQSHIHDTLISIGAWFIQGIGGIRADERAPGFKHFFVKPAVVGDLSFARARYQSIRGDIISEWRIQDGAFRLTVTVPPGAAATVVVPGRGPVKTKTPRAGGAAGQAARSYEAGPGVHTFETAINR